jgi:hypothetical protein
LEAESQISQYRALFMNGLVAEATALTNEWSFVRDFGPSSGGFIHKRALYSFPFTDR